MQILRMIISFVTAFSSTAALAQEEVNFSVGTGANVARAIPLAPNEMLLTVRGKGLQVSRPDFASLAIGMTTKGNDNAAALSANQQLIARVRKIVTDVGIDPSAVQTLQGEATARLGFVGGEAFDPDKAIPNSYASSSMLVRFTDMEKMGKVRAQLQPLAEVQLGNATYGLNDDSSARRAAVDQALAKAKNDAAIYGKAMNMKVGRIVAVRDVAGSFAADNLMEMMAERGRMPDTGVRTEARIEVDVVLQPL